MERLREREIYIYVKLFFREGFVEKINVGSGRSWYFNGEESNNS